MKSINLIISILFFSITLSSQNGGIILNGEGSLNGYTLFSALRDTDTYLIDNCGSMVNHWESEYNPGLVCYLTEDGDLLRTGDYSWSLPGGGGIIERFNWEGDLEWSYVLQNDSVRLHHDIEMLPNGNILALAWESRALAEAAFEGKAELHGTHVLVNKIVELSPVGKDSATIVWEWHIWDHIIQDLFPNRKNYGVVADHPEKLDINLEGHFFDWSHLNSIDFNPRLDQIIISAGGLNEFFIIDHSTTTEEAAGSTGGNSGMGGDLLYRWGNPINYRQGSESDQKCFYQHDVHWIPEGLKDGGKIMFFNNRNPGDYSTVEKLELPTNGYNFIKEKNLAFSPEKTDWQFGDTNYQFSSSVMSGTQQLSNGNILICIQAEDRIIEIDENENVVWEYNIPISVGKPSAFKGSGAFRAYKYSTYYPGLLEKDLSPQGLIELEADIFWCENGLQTHTTEINLTQDFKLRTNPIDSELHLDFTSSKESEFVFSIYSADG